MVEDWHTLAGRLRWAVFEHQPAQGRQRGMRLFQRRLSDSAPNVEGTSLSAIQVYLRSGKPEPSLDFVESAARVLAVRPSWLAWGEGAPTEEEEAGRRGESKAELFRISTAVYDALGVPTTVPAGTPTLGEPDGAAAETARFWGPAIWAPLVRQTVLRLFQRRPLWDLLEHQSRYPKKPTDEAFRDATAAVAEAVAAPLRSLGIDASKVQLDDLADYVQAVSLQLSRVIHHYLPKEEDDDA